MDECARESLSAREKIRFLNVLMESSTRRQVRVIRLRI
jgi:hypothetical protein